MFLSVFFSHVFTAVSAKIGWVLSSVWGKLTYHERLRYRQCVPSVIVMPLSAVMTADSGSKMAE